MSPGNYDVEASEVSAIIDFRLLILPENKSVAHVTMTTSVGGHMTFFREIDAEHARRFQDMILSWTSERGVDFSSFR